LVAYYSDWADVVCLAAHRAPDVCDNSTAGRRDHSEIYFERSKDFSNEALSRGMWGTMSGGAAQSLLWFAGMHIQEGRAALVVAECTSYLRLNSQPYEEGIVFQGGSDGVELRDCSSTGGLKATRNSAATRLLQATR
jgi:hypothetical protein